MTAALIVAGCSNPAADKPAAEADTVDALLRLAARTAVAPESR